MATILQLQTWLSEAETARHNLATGSMVEEIFSPDGSKVRYMPSNIGKLDAYIGSLQAQIAAGSTTALPSRGPIRFSPTFE